jgi:hypothetical protein
VNADVPAEILARLDLVVFERLPEGVFVPVETANPPEWFSRMFLDAASGTPTTLAAAFPFLERFLSTAETLWLQGDLRKLRSDAFTVTDPSGGELSLVASALAVDHRRFLVLEASAEFDEHRRTLQRAREDALTHEDHVRRTGALTTPANAALKLAEQLAAETGLTAEQRRLVSELRAQLAIIGVAIETLAPLPKGVTRGRH